ncbi:MAG: hypothetical protein J0L92_40075 [Deltaproteobacteria bacterium]|nr:hypothetical protein [Deltaproteobacteria bacterium]
MSRRQLLALQLLLVAACEPTSATPDAALAADTPRADSPISPADEIGMNDVSILFPLDEGGMALWPITIAGSHGPLLDAAAYASVAPLRRGEAAPLDALRVVAVRLDPCFPADGGACQPMVRLVAQPLRLGVPGFDDAAVHLHYPITDVELDVMLETIASARESSGVASDAAFGVHPALASEGVVGSFGAMLRTLVLDHAGLDRLDRITFTTRTASRAASWEWGRIDREGGSFVRVAMPASGTSATELQSLTGDGLRAYTTTPPSPTAGLLVGAFGMSDDLGSTPEAERAAILGRIQDVLHPARENPESVDCASCHVAMHADRAARAAWPGVTPSSEPFTSSLPLDTPTPTLRDRIRAFGYFDEEPQINTRVVNETAAVVEAFRARR